MPPEVFQSLTDLDKKKIHSLCHASNEFVHGTRNGDRRQGGDGKSRRLEELELMAELGYKVELESLNWLSMDYVTNWVLDALVANEQYQEEQTFRTRHGGTKEEDVMDPMEDGDDDGDLDLRIAI